MTIGTLDVGGTSVKRGLVDLPDRVSLLEPVAVDALEASDLVLSQLSEAVSSMADESKTFFDLAVAFPRPFDMAKGVPLLQGVRKFDSIYGIPLAPVFRSGAGRDLRISFCGDAIAAAVGESAAGAGRSYRRILMVTVGTGFGAALVVDGVPVEEYGGRLVEGIHDEPAGVRGTADEALSAFGLAELLRVQMPQLMDAAKDPVHADQLEEYGRDLGRFLADQAAHFEADVVVVGGGAAAAFDLFGAAACDEVGVPLVPAALGERAALLGAALLHGTGPVL